MLRTKVLTEDRGLGKCKTLQVAFLFPVLPECLSFSTLGILIICWFVFVWGFFCAFLTLSSRLFTEFHFFPSNLRSRSEVLDHLIVLPVA